MTDHTPAYGTDAYALARIAHRARLVLRDHYGDYLHSMTEAHAVTTDPAAPGYMLDLAREWRHEARAQRRAAAQVAFILAGAYPRYVRWNPPADHGAQCPSAAYCVGAHPWALSP